MRFEFDPVADAAYVTLVDIVDIVEDGEVAETRVCMLAAALDGASIHLDFDAERRLLGIEILGASRVLRPETLESNWGHPRSAGLS